MKTNLCHRQGFVFISMERFECVIVTAGGSHIDRCAHRSIPLFSPSHARRKCKRHLSISAASEEAKSIPLSEIIRSAARLVPAQ